MNETNDGTSKMKGLLEVLGGIGLLLAMITLQACSTANAGPNGGDVVPINDGKATAEVVANADTGEVMVHTWDKNLKTSQPIEAKPLVIGSGDQTIELQPHPTVGDPTGLCSRFYGQADWLRGGGMHHGWLAGTNRSRKEFAWNNCWTGGQSHSSMWSDMGDQRRGMMGHRPATGMRRE